MAIPELHRDDVRQLLEEGRAQLLEVLPRRAYEREHLPGALNIPLGELDREAARRLDAGRPVIVYCASDT